MIVTDTMVEVALQSYYYSLETRPERQVRNMLEAALGNVADMHVLKVRVEVWARHETPVNFRSLVVGLLELNDWC